MVKAVSLGVDYFLRRPKTRIEGPSILGLPFIGRTTIFRAPKQLLTTKFMEKIRNRWGVETIELLGREPFMERDIAKALNGFAAKASEISLSKGCVKVIVISHKAEERDFVLSIKRRGDSTLKIFIAVPVKSEKIGETLEAARNVLVGNLMLKVDSGPDFVGP